MNEAVSLGQMIGWYQWAPLSLAAENEAGLIGTDYCVEPGVPLSLAVISRKTEQWSLLGPLKEWSGTTHNWCS